MDNISRWQKRRVGWKVPKRTKTKRWAEHLQLIPKIAPEAKKRSVIHRQHGLGIVASVGLYRTPYQLMPYTCLSRQSIWRVHSRLRWIDWRFWWTITELNLNGFPPLNLGISDKDVVVHLWWHNPNCERTTSSTRRSSGKNNVPSEYTKRQSRS
jgi:hypothetical protein